MGNCSLKGMTAECENPIRILTDSGSGNMINFHAGVGVGVKRRDQSETAAEKLSDKSGLEVLPTGGDGVWRVRLVINTKELEEILAEEVNTEALIQRIRAAATATATVNQSPRRLKTGKGWGSNWKPTFASLLKAQNKDFNSAICSLHPS